jgi:endo-1,3(4)-beta-glucanase
MSIQHIEESQRVFGPNLSANPVEYFINPIGIQSLILSAAELGPSTELSLDSVGAFSVNVNFLPSAGAKPAITFPLVQGMGFITAVFDGSATPVLQTGIFFRSVTKALDPKPNVTKYIILLEDGTTWLLYAYSPEGLELDFTVVDNSLAQGTSTFNGIIQIAKNPGSAELVYDTACGAFVTTATLSGSVDRGTGNYTLSFVNAGITNTSLLMFALPHHVESFSPASQSALTSLQLSTTTKGLATAVIADSWTLTESLPISMGFAPWSPSLPNKQMLSGTAISVIQSVAAGEVSQNMSQQTNLDSMYYSGKVSIYFLSIIYDLYLIKTGTGKVRRYRLYDSRSPLERRLG